MHNILINGLKAKAGGGKNILMNFLSGLNSGQTWNTYYVLCPDIEEYCHLQSDSIRIIDVRNIFKLNILFPALYFYEMPKLLDRYKIDLIFNFGDVIIPASRHQIYFFDWAYAVYDEDYIWKRMGIKDYLMRKTKAGLINLYINKIDLVLAQSNVINCRLRQKYGIENVETLATPISDFKEASNEFLDFNLPKDKIKFLFPAGWAPHKNFELIVHLSQWVYQNKLPYVLVLCVQQKDVDKHLRGLQTETTINLGIVPGKQMNALYKQCDTLFLPSLIESYGLPYVEAMAHNMPIVTSDLDFAREMCGELAHYFNPFEVESAGKAMLSSQGASDSIRLEKIRKAKLSKIPDWPEAIFQIQSYINEVLSNKL